MDTVFILGEHLLPELIICNVFDKYFYLKHLWMVVIKTGGHLQWSRIFKGTVFLWDKHLQSSLFSRILSWFVIPVAVIHSMNGCFFYYKRAVVATQFFKFTELLRTRGVAWWLATCTLKPKVPGSNLAASYVQRWAVCSNFLANV